MGLFNILGGAPAGVGAKADDSGGILSGIGEFVFGKGPDVEAAQSAVNQGTLDATQSLQQGKDESLKNLIMGLNQAQGTLQPSIDRGNQYQSDIRNLLMGNTDVSTLPGFNAMSNARRDAVGDLGTGMAGTGKFFSGTTAERAADIGGAMENQFLQQYLNNLMMGAQPGQQATSQLAGMQMGVGTTGAQIPMNMASNIANIKMGGAANMGNMIMADQSEGIFGDVLGAAATLGGAYLGATGGKNELIRAISGGK